MPENGRQPFFQESQSKDSKNRSKTLLWFKGKIDLVSWKNFAACRSPIVEMITPPEEDSELLAETYCFFCPVRNACLDAAFSFGNPNGIWGGTNSDERRAIRRIPGIVEQLHESVLERRQIQEIQIMANPIILEEFGQIAEEAKVEARTIFQNRKEHGVIPVEVSPWIGTLSREGMNLGRAVLFARLDLLLEKTQFAQKAGIGDDQLGLIERNMVTPMPAELNLIIEASRLDPMGIPAQMMRLLREGRLPMELSELQTCSFGDLFQYIRQLKGDSPADAARAAKVDPQTIRNVESSSWGMRKSTKRKILSYMDLDPRSAMAEIAFTKLDNPDTEIPTALLKRIIKGKHDGRYLFAESLQGVRIKNTVEEDLALGELETIRQELVDYGASNAEILGALLLYEREKRGFTIDGVAEAIQMDVKNLINIENGNKGNIQTVTRMKILAGMELRIHDPETWFFTDFDQQAA
jgi:WhiB family redox-sensing transcriptional regulator